MRRRLYAFSLLTKLVVKLHSYLALAGREGRLDSGQGGGRRERDSRCWRRGLRRGSMFVLRAR